MKQLLRAVPPGVEIVLADVGSAGGLKVQWAPARSIVSAMLFEPREEAEASHHGRDIIYPVALGAAPGRAELHLTALPNMSSLLRPNAALMNGFRKKAAHTAITANVQIPLDTLDAVAEKDGRTVDAIKIDTQGTELQVLRGATRCLTGSIIVAEVEVSFLQRYEGQPLFAEIEAFMRQHGFELIDFQRLKRYRACNAAGVGNVGLGTGKRAGRIAYGDGLFFLDDALMAARIDAAGENLAFKALVAYCIYGKADLAAALFERTSDHFAPARRDRVAAYFRSLRGIRRNGLHHVIDYLSRYV